MDTELLGPCTFSFGIVGASRYQGNLSKLAGGRKRKSADLLITALLVVEDGNPHDKNAVRVDVNGLTVGYLDRDNAREYRRLLASKGHNGDGLGCAARIVGGWYKSDDDQGHFGVRLDLHTV